MPKRFFRQFLPDYDRIRTHKGLQCFGTLLHDPNIWHLNRHSVAGACSVGLFIAFVPIPFQMLLAAGAAIPLRVNLPLSVCVVWITNPVTIPPMFFTAYKVGAWMLNIPPEPFHFELSWQWLGSGLISVWQPFLLGCFVLGVFSAALGNVAIRVFWRLQIAKYLQRRRERRKNKA